MLINIAVKTADLVSKIELIVNIISAAITIKNHDIFLNLSEK